MGTLLTLVSFVGAVVGYRSSGWKWLPAVLLAGWTAIGVWVISLTATYWLRNWRNQRRGLATREWTAVNTMANCAEISNPTNFDTFSRTRLRRTDDRVVIGYATILVHLQAVAHLRLLDVENPVEYLAAQCVPRWQAVIRQHPDRLRYLLNAALAYEQTGFPSYDWDNIRALAALSGVLRSSRLHLKSVRFEVARRYEQHASAERIATGGQ